jgi:hypothetical protein
MYDASVCLAAHKNAACHGVSGRNGEEHVAHTVQHHHTYLLIFKYAIQNVALNPVSSPMEIIKLLV